MPLRLLLSLYVVFAIGVDVGSEIKPLPNAHAHNDYEHPRPLFDALDRGFCSVEADIYLVDGELLVGHNRSDLRSKRTLQSLYLEPLRHRVAENGGRVFRDGPPFYLLVDIKSEARSTYVELARVLRRYEVMLSVSRGGRFERKAVTVVVSGNRAFTEIAAEPIRFVGIDGRPTNLDADDPPDRLPWISENWNSMFRWKGVGAMPESERTKLATFVRKAHARGRLVRFWATPETAECWQVLRETGVDLLNTDKLDVMREFLLRKS